MALALPPSLADCSFCPAPVSRASPSLPFLDLLSLFVSLFPFQAAAAAVAEARFYDKALIDKAEQELKRQYVGKGMDAASPSESQGIFRQRTESDG